jgi:hypothetical protein
VPALGEADAEVRASFDRFCLAAGIEELCGNLGDDGMR